MQHGNHQDEPAECSVASSSDRREGQGPLLQRPQGSGPVLEVLTDIEVKHNMPLLVLISLNSSSRDIELSHVCLRGIRECSMHVWIAHT